MADYYSLLTKAVGGLPDQSAPSRKAIYERARHALLKQLRSIEPALPDADITRERLALEEAIRRVELNQAKLNNTPLEPTLKAPTPLLKPALEKPIVVEPAPVVEVPVVEAHIEPEPAVEVPVVEAHIEPAPVIVAEVIPELAIPEVVAELPAEEPSVEAPFKAELPSWASSVLKPKPNSPAVAPEVEATEYHAKGKVHFDHLPEAPIGKSRIALYLVIGMLIGLLSLFAIWHFSTSPKQEPAPAPRVITPAAPTPAPVIEKKDDQRIDQDRPSTSGNLNQTPSVAPAILPPKVVFFEETPGGQQQGVYLQGSVKWANENYQDQGQPQDIMIVGDVKIPDRQLTLKIKIKRNLDKTLSASHLLEITTSTTGVSQIAAMPGFLMKQGEQTRGQPISAQAVKIVNGFFLIGLSAIDADITRNVELVRDWNYLDFPIELENKRRAILTIEKGADGDKAFASAFTAWGL